MAAALRAAKGLRLVAGAPGLAFTRSAFVARSQNYDQPNWFGVGLAFSTSAALWAFVDGISVRSDMITSCPTTAEVQSP